MFRPLLAACVLLGACGSDTHDLTLEVDGSCQPAELAEVAIISVELWGIDDEGRPCAIARRCIYDVELATVDDVTTAMAAVNQPLIDVEDPDAHTLAVIGHTGSCFDHTDHAMCGFADLADRDDGVLEVGLACTACPVQEIAFCP